MDADHDSGKADPRMGRPGWVGRARTKNKAVEWNKPASNSRNDRTVQ